MHKQIWHLFSDASKPIKRFSLATAQLSVFPHGPPLKRTVELIQDRV
jgi:hypothetical protein